MLRRTLSFRRSAIAAAVAAGSLAVVPSALGLSIQARPGDSGRTVYVKKGDTIKVTLADNPSTPYSWSYQTRPSGKILKLVSNVYVANPHPPGFVGGGGHRTWTFKVLKGGTTSFTLVLRYIAAPHNVGGRFTLHVTQG
jgi:predicted secreted protein